MGIIGYLITKKIGKDRINRRLDVMDEVNSLSRNIIKYVQTPITAYADIETNNLISGLNNKLRSNLITRIAYLNYEQKKKVVIFHPNNTILNDIIEDTFKDSSSYINIYSPFIRLEKGLDISNALPYYTNDETLVIMINIHNVMNKQIFDVMLEEASSIDAYIIFDSFPLDTSKYFTDYLINTNQLFTYVHEDVTNNQNIFNKLITKEHNLYIFKHNSSIAASRISQFIGKHRRTETRKDVNYIELYLDNNKLLPGTVLSDCYGTCIKHLPRLTEDDILKLDESTIYFKNSIKRQISKYNCIYADPKLNFIKPTKGVLVQERKVREVNLYIFALLIFTISPLAFVYTYIKFRLFGRILSFFLFFIFLVIYIEFIVFVRGLINSN